MSNQPLSQLDQTLRSFRATLLRRDAAVLAIVDRRWRVVQRMLLDDLDLLTTRIAEAEASGEEVKVSWLRKERRYRDFILQVETLIRSYAADLAPTIQAGQQVAVAMAAEHAAGLVQSQLGERAEWSRLPAEATNEMIGRLTDGSPLPAYLRQFGAAAVASAEEVLIQGVATGQGVRVIQRQLDAIFGKRGTVDPGLIGRKAMMTARSSVLNSYRDASMESYKQNADLLDGWVWIASIGSRCCPVCVAKHGSIHPVGDPFFSHLMCRCTPAPRTKSWSQIFGRPVDIPETRLEVEPGEQVFTRLDSALQLTILGPTKLRMFNAGQLTFDQLVAETNSAKWGRGLRERSLREIRA